MTGSKTESLYITGSYLPDYPRHKVLISAFKRCFPRNVERNMYDKSFTSIRSLVSFLSNGLGSSHVLIMDPAERFFLLAFVLRFIFRKKVMFDAFAPAYEGFVLDRALAKRGSLKGMYYFFSGYLMIRASSMAFFDTKEHLEFFKEKFKAPPGKQMFVLPVALDLEEVGEMLKGSQSTLLPAGKFNIVFYGKYIPLQGVEHIIDAASELRSRTDIFFTLIGSGQTFKDIQKKAQALSLQNVKFIPRMSYPELFTYMAQTDVVLGIFGTSEKAKRVIANKVLEALAAKALLITGENSALQRYFKDREDLYFVPMGDGKAIAEAIVHIEKDRGAFLKMGENGRRKVEECFSLESLIKQVKQNIIGG